MIQLTLNFAKIAPMLTTTFEATLLQSLKTSKQQKKKSLKMMKMTFHSHSLRSQNKCLLSKSNENVEVAFKSLRTKVSW